MPIGRLKLAEFGRFVFGEYQFLEWVDFEAYPGTSQWLCDCQEWFVFSFSNDFGVDSLIVKENQVNWWQILFGE